MSTFDVVFVSLVVAAFTILGLVLAWGAARTAGLHKENTPAE